VRAGDHYSKDQEFLLPANPAFIGMSMFVALMLNWLPWEGLWLALRPDFASLVLLYWCTHKPHRIGIGIAWAIGIFADVADSSLFGQHALSYSVLAFGGILLHRRIQMFDVREQPLQVFPLLLISYAVFAAVHWLMRGTISWEYFLGTLTSALLWMPLSILLQTMRRSRSDPNEL
jgi:rod shape-determining protein MreD